jgi:hypothetical protein
MHRMKARTQASLICRRVGDLRPIISFDAKALSYFQQEVQAEGREGALPD